MGDQAKKQKQLVYRFNGDPSSDEAVPDLDGDVAVPAKGAMVNVKGKSWKVAEVKESPDMHGELRLYLVLLTDN